MRVKLRFTGFNGTDVVRVKNNGEVIYNDKLVDIDAGIFCDRLKQIVKTWKFNYSTGVLDAPAYKIVIEEKNTTLMYVGQGEYPKNFKKFTSLLEEVKRCTISNTKD